jgi:hypothetical protein
MDAQPLPPASTQESVTVTGPLKVPPEGEAALVGGAASGGDDAPLEHAPSAARGRSSAKQRGDRMVEAPPRKDAAVRCGSKTAHPGTRRRGRDDTKEAGARKPAATVGFHAVMTVRERPRSPFGGPGPAVEVHGAYL